MILFDHSMMKKTKSRRRKFSTCFKPVVDVEFGGEEEAVEKRDRVATKGVSFGGDTVTVDDDGGKRERCRKSFSRVVRAVLFWTILSKRVGNKKSKNNSAAPSSNLSTSTKPTNKNASTTKELSDTDQNMSRSNSSDDSSVFSSTIIDSAISSISSSSCSSRSTSQRRIDLIQVINNNNNNNNNNVVKEGSSGVVQCCYFSNYNVGLCFLAGLLVLLIWGKAFAIFWTSLCLFLAPPRRFKVLHPRVNDVEMLDFYSDEYKKRVIMEGLLQRNRSRVFR